MSKEDSQLKRLSDLVERLVNKEVAPVAPVLPIAPIAPIAPIISVDPLDHQLLLNLDKNFVRLDTKVDQIQLDVSALKNQGDKYVTQIEHKEVVICQNDHETRIRDNESKLTKIMTYGSAVIVILGIVEFLVSRFLKL